MNRFGVGELERDGAFVAVLMGSVENVAVAEGGAVSEKPERNVGVGNRGDSRFAVAGDGGPVRIKACHSQATRAGRPAAGCG